MVMIKKRNLTFRGDFMDTLTWEQLEVFRLLKNQPGTQYQESNEQERKLLRDWIQGLLNVSEVTVQFVKSDGTVRLMRCTLDRSRIPPAPPKTQPMPAEIVDSSTANVDGLAESRKPRREPDPVNQRVYDLDLGEWRSFRYDRLKKISAEINIDK
jgi:WYL_2, Sm-like SH3 beta-barrel fold